MRILGTFVILCAIFCTACGYKPTNHEARVAASVENSYDAGIAAYKRGHYQAALYDFELRANQGDPVAQFCLGFMYNHRQIPIPKKFQGEATEWYTVNAQEWYTKAAEQDYLPAQNNLGVMYARLYEKSKGKNSKALEDAEKWFQKAATNGYPPGQFNFAITTEDAAAVVKWTKEAANQGYPPAQDYLGELYYHGDVIDKDLKAAVEWYRAAANHGDASAQSSLGMCYSNGMGVEKNYEEAFKWYKKAAEQGDVHGQFDLGRCYHLGEGVNQDLQQAARWYIAAAKQGYRAAQNNLGVIYITETENFEMASRWYLRAAQQGQTIAQTNIGRRFEKGQDGVPQDAREAYYWYSLALRDKAALKRALTKDLVSEATEAFDRIGKSLNKESISQIKSQVDNWRSKRIEGAGTGFYIDKNYILTNAHVVISNWQEVLEGGQPVFFDEFRIPYRRVTLKVVSPKVDLALLYDERGNTDENGNTVIAKFRGDPIEFGEKIIQFGYPKSSKLSYEGNLTSGIVSGLSDKIDVSRPENRFQHTAPTQRGNSGGPVFDAEGSVIGVSVYGLQDYVPVRGVDSYIPQTVNIAQNINFAIHFHVVVEFLRENGIFVLSSDPLKSGLEIAYELATTSSIGESVPSKGESIKEIPLGTIKTEAKQFTVPVLGFKHKTDPPLSVEEITIEELK